MFVDLVGFTSLSCTLDPEPLSSLLTAYFDAVIPHIEAHGGFIDKLIGDGVMALFGAPTAHIDDPERAILASLDVKRALMQCRGPSGKPFEAHIGINTGLVVTGRFGSAKCKSYTVLGETVNTTARLESVSRPGQILVGRQTYLATRRRFDFEPVVNLRLKGVDSNYTAYEVKGERTGKKLPELTCRCVGRESQRAVLAACRAELLAGRGGLVDMVGEATTGKTTLLEWLWNEPVTKDAQAVFVTCPSVAETDAYAAFRSILDGVLKASGENGCQSRLLELLERDHPLEAALIGQFLGLELPQSGETVQAMEDKDAGLLFFKALRELFRSALARRPLLLIVDDFHWIDFSSHKALGHIAVLIKDLPLLLICSRRPEIDSHVETLFGQVRVETGMEAVRVILGGFLPEEIDAMCRGRLGGPVAQALVDALAEYSSGNPFILERTIDYLVETNRLFRKDGAWHLDKGLSLESLPLTNDVQGLIVAQIDSLTGRHKDILRNASVIGRSFLYKILLAIVEEEKLAEDDVQQLENIDILLSCSSMHDKEYLFKSAMMHAVIYENQLMSFRRQMHQKIGSHIESTAHDTLGSSCGILAYHYTRAENWAKAGHYLEALGDFTARFSDDASTVCIYKSALKLYLDTFADRLDAVELAKFDRKIGEVYFRAGDHDSALAYFQSAQKKMGLTQSPDGLKLFLGIVGEFLSLVFRWFFPGKRPAVASEEAKRLFLEIARIQETLVWVYFFLKPKQYFYETIRATKMHIRFRFQPGLVRSFSSLGVVFTILRQNSLAKLFLFKGASIAESLEDPSALCLSWLCLGIFHEYECRWEEALEAYRKTREYAWSVGRLQEWGSSAGMAGNILFHLGRTVEALGLSQDMLEHGIDCGDKQLQAYGLTGKAIYLKLAGKLTEALELFLLSNELLLGVKNYYVSLWNYTHILECLMGLGHPDQVQTSIEDACCLILKQELQGLFVMVFAVKSLAARRWFEDRGYNRSGFNGDAPLLRALRAKAGRFRVVMPELLCLDACEAWKKGRRTKARQRFESSLEHARAIDDLRGAWRVYTERFKLAGDEADRRHAQEVLESWRARHDLNGSA